MVRDTKKLDQFYKLVDYIYDEEGWKSYSTFSANIIKELKMMIKKSLFGIEFVI